MSPSGSRISSFTVAELSTAAGVLVFTPRRIPLRGIVTEAIVVCVATTRGTFFGRNCILRDIGLVLYLKKYNIPMQNSLLICKYAHNRFLPPALAFPV